MTSSEEVYIPRSYVYSNRLANRCLQLRKDGEHTDFRILSGNKSFDCHKAILSANSDVLRDMMKSQTTEAPKGEVTMDNVPPAVLELLLSYMYTGETRIPCDLLQSTVKACDYLGLQELKERCLNQAVTLLKPSNAISWYKTAEKLGLHKMKAKCSEVMSSSFHEVAKEMEFLELTLAEISSCIKDVQETEADPDDVLEGTFGWISHQPDQRVEDMEDLLKKIQLLNCSGECLHQELKLNEALLDRQPTVYKLLTQNLATIGAQAGRRKRRERKGRRNVRVLVISGNGNEDIWELDSSAQFVKLSKLPECLKWLSVCRTPDGFAVTGGVGSVICSKYVLATNSWVKLEPLPVVRYEHGSVCFSGRIFVLGGLVSGKKSSSVQSLHLVEVGGKWTDEPNIPQTVSYPAVASVASSIFLLDIYTGKLLHLDVTKKVWSYRQSIPGRRCVGVRMIAVDDDLLVAGGNSVKRTFARYNPSTDTWTTGNHPALIHDFGALVYSSGRVYVIGGRNEDRIEEFNLSNESWSECAVKVPKKIHNLYAVVLNG